MSKDKNQITVGINREIIDTETDSSAEFHVIRHVSLDYATGFNVVLLDSYVRKSTFERRGRSVGSMQLNIPGVPPRGTDVLDWAYQAVVAAVEGGRGRCLRSAYFRQQPDRRGVGLCRFA
ncbi:TPA: hypothetical protein ACJJCA_000057 [Neisseria meningitidis]|uniref:hypothetical protein n=1 Tax=Neisseria meningitidis TaxID=487 RepID=UPI002181E40A|nr:hypothetical protein [Neisseria meningitidis]